MSKLTISTIRTLISTFNTASRRAAAAWRFRYEQPLGSPLTLSGERLHFHQAVADAAYQALATTLAGADWGAHDHGRIFVRQLSHWPSAPYLTTVVVHIDGLPVVSIVHGRDNLDDVEVFRRLKLHDADEERAIREGDRAAARAHEAAQAEARARIAGELRHGRVPRGVVAVDGQRGGYLEVGGELRLAIRGVLRAAGVDPGDHPFEAWTGLVREMTEAEPQARVRARALPAKVRHLRAREQA